MSSHGLSRLVEWLAEHGWHATPVDDDEYLVCTRGNERETIPATRQDVRNFLGY